MNTDRNREQLGFGTSGSREVIADFDGGRLSSDGGALLIRTAEEKTRTVERFVSAAVTDHRRPDLVEHPALDLFKQRVFGLALGYEDLNDHDSLMTDRLLAAALAKDDPTGQHRRREADLGKPLASSSTLNRLELTPEHPARERYKRIDIDPELADDVLVDCSIDRMRAKDPDPKELVIDLDPSDVPLHGQQEGRFFHGYYGNYCYLPLYAFCGEYLLAVRLQSAAGDPSFNSLEILERIVPRLRAAFPRAKIIVRADSGFSRERIYAWLEENGSDYAIGIAKNKRLVAAIEEELAQAAALHAETGQPARVFTDFTYSTRDSWSRERRVVAKAEQLEGKANPRFIVTSLDSDPRVAYEEVYCPRGEAENRIKEQQLYLFGKRASASEMRANQNRLYFSALAYMLMQVIREIGLEGTEESAARADSIRLKLFKIAARVRVTVRRVWVNLSSHSPYQELFRRVYANLVAAPEIVM